MHRPASLVRLLACALALGCAACGGGGGGDGDGDDPGIPPPPPPPPPPQGADVQYLVSAASPFTAGCDNENIGGTLYINAEVEPWLAVNPLDDRRMVGVWQQDRWSNGSSRGVLSATSTDGGQTWTRQPVPFSRCGGGTAGNGGDYARVSNPWVSYAPDGTVHAVGLASNGVLFQPGSSNAIVASRSLDDGSTWSDPIALIRDGSGFFNDKDAITADPGNANLVYAVWDRLVAGDNGAPTYFARSTDGGVSWEAARPIYDPGQASQTISNVIVVLPSGTLVNMFVQIDYGTGTGNDSAHIAVVRSFDKGVHWSIPITVSDLQSVGTQDPQDASRTVRDAAIIPQIAVATNGDLFVVWQDGRFSNGARDAIAISRSIDDGATWTAPTRVSGDAGVAAFDPAVHVRSDGILGVTYYDFRSDTPAATLMTDYWLARSVDGGTTWTESRVSEPFDISVAPLTTSTTPGGYFLGDYQGLSSRGNVFLPFFTKANNGNTNNRTDIFSAPALSATTSALGAVRRLSSVGAVRNLPRSWATPRIEDRVGANLRRARHERVPTPGNARIP